jgi:tetratricopeptide (TPR) repeat protein
LHGVEAIVNRLQRLIRTSVLAGVAMAVMGSALPARADIADDLKLADGLLRFRMYDMARMVFDRAVTKGSSAEQLEGKLGLVKLLKVQALNERDPERQKELFDQAIKQFQELLKGGGGGGNIDAKFQLADLLTEKGMALITQLEQADSDADREAARTEALEVFSQVNTLFEEVVNDYRPKWEEAKDLDTGELDPKIFDPAKEADLIKGWLLQGESLYHRGRINTDKRSREQDLKKAVESLDDFIWEFEDRIVGFWAYITQGRCYAALAKYGNAAQSYGAVLALDVDDFTADVRMMAYFRLGEALNQGSQFEQVVAAITKMEEEYPGKVLSKPQGQEAILEKGVALAGQQQFKAAIGEAMKIVACPTPYKRARALKLLAGWAAMDPSVGAEIAFLQGKGFKNQGSLTRKEKFYYRAIAAFQEAAQNLKTDEEKKEYGAKIWKQIGDCYFVGLERYYEAGLAYTRGAKFEAGPKLERGECAYWAYRAFQERYKGTRPDPFDRDLYREARSYFTSSFPNDPRKGNIPFYEAKDLEDDAKYSKAAEAYERLNPTSEKFEIALARAGGCYYKDYAARAKKAGGKPSSSDKQLLVQSDTKLRSFLKRTSTADPTMKDDKDRLAARQNARALSEFYLARIAEARKEYRKVVDQLAKFRETYGSGQTSLVSSVLMLQLQSLVKLESVEEADVKLAELKEFNERFAYLGAAQQLVASLMDNVGKKLEDQGKLSEAAIYKRKAARGFAAWIKDDTKAQKDRNNVLGVAYRLRKVGQAEDAAERFDEALAFYSDSSSLFALLRAKAVAFKIPASTLAQINGGLTDNRVRSAEILDMMGKTDQAASAWKASLDLLKEQYAKKKTRQTVERLANAYSKADKLDDALKLFSDLLKRTRQYTPEWWDSKYWQIEIQLRMVKTLQTKGKKKASQRKLEIVKGLLENLRLLTPQLGGPEAAKRFAALADTCGLTTGWENYK